MKRNHIFRICRLFIIFATVMYCLWMTFNAILPYVNSSDALNSLMEWRIVSRKAPIGKLALLCRDASHISPVDRSRLIAMTWERIPEPVIAVDSQCDLNDIDVILSSKWITSSMVEWLKNNQFTISEETEYVSIWAKPNTIQRNVCNHKSLSSYIREIFALCFEFSLMFIVFVRLIGVRDVNKVHLIIVGVLSALLGLAAISHPLLSPNGLGVYAGKAKLLYEFGGIPKTFLGSVGGEVIQTFYPPGLTLLTYMHFALSGGCGDRIVQMLVVFAMVLICLLMLRRLDKLFCVMMVVLFCLSPITVRMSAGFYAEPFVALMLLVGWVKIREGRLFLGCFLMGLAGLFRLEAGIVATIFSIGAGVFSLRVRDKVIGSFLSLLPLLVWLSIASWCEYRNVSDWNFSSLPKIDNIVYAAWCEIKALVLYTLPVMVIYFLSCFSRKSLMCSENVFSILPMLILLLLIPLACGFYTSPYASWMMDNTIPRLMWYISAIPLYELIRHSNRNL